MAFRNVPIDVNIRNTKNVEGDIIKVEMPGDIFGIKKNLYKL